MAASKRLLVELYYDVISPYSYLCFEALCRYRQPWDMDLQLKPFYLGGVMRESGNKPPGILPNRMVYMLGDLERLSNYYKVHLKIPGEFGQWIFKKTTMDSQRFLCALKLQNPEYLEAVTRGFYQRLFILNEENMSRESIEAVAKKASLPQNVIDSCMQAIDSEDVKGLLKQHTDEALEQYAFGAPTFVAHINGEKEMFFGQDRIELMAHMAGKKFMGPLPDQKCKL